MKKHIIALLLSATLISCSSPAPKQTSLNIDFSSQSRMALQVQKLNIVNRSSAYPARQVSPVFKPSLTEAIYGWAQDRLQTTGAPGQANLIIKEASFVDQPIPLASGMESWFTRQQSHKYIAKIDVDIEARSGDGLINAFATAHAVRTSTLPEDPTEAEKTAVYNDMLNGLMHDLNQNLEIAMRQHMSQFIAASF